MPDDNGVSGAQNLAKGAGKSVGKAGKTAGKAGKKITDNISEQISKLFKGKKKWLAAILAVVLFGICVLLIMAIVLLMLTSAYTANEGNKQNASAGSSLQQKGTFYPRLEEPVKGKESVNHTGKKVDDYYFNSTNPLEAAGYGMPNCTAYAWSRAYEILDSVPNLCTGNAQEWYGYNKKLKEIRSRFQTPHGKAHFSSYWKLIQPIIRTTGRMTAGICSVSSIYLMSL